MAYRVTLTLIAGPKPSIVPWRDIAIKEALGRATMTKPTKSLNTPPPVSFLDALVNALGSLKETTEAIKLKTPPQQPKKANISPGCPNTSKGSSTA
jgi:hypothetical protein